MFTGIVEAAVHAARFELRGSGARLVLPAPDLPPHAQGAPWAVRRGDSVSVSGCCLTVADFVALDSGAPIPDETAAETPDPGRAAMAFDLSAETLARTWLGALADSSYRRARRVNLERAMQLGERLGGHLVSGHVDGTGRLTAVDDVSDGGRVLSFELDSGLERYLIQKGSITVDGVSLTVVDPSGPTFSVAAIPVTLDLTNLGALRPGDSVHVEADLVGKWIERLMPRGE